MGVVYLLVMNGKRLTPTVTLGERISLERAPLLHCIGISSVKPRPTECHLLEIGDAPALGNSLYDDNPLNGSQVGERHACFLPADVILVGSLRLLYHLLPSPLLFNLVELKLNAWNRSYWDPWN